ncbi:hypothetical protein D3C85_1787270 [compost metagenome]
MLDRRHANVKLIRPTGLIDLLLDDRIYRVSNTVLELANAEKLNRVVASQEGSHAARVLGL